MTILDLIFVAIIVAFGAALGFPLGFVVGRSCVKKPPTAQLRPQAPPIEGRQKAW